jgi:hypothetical protein
VEIPARIERTIGDMVAHHLETEFERCGLLLTADGLAAAEAEVARCGTRLLNDVIQLCYPIRLRGGRSLALEFERQGNAARLTAALAFGAITARVLAPGRRDSAQFAESVELVCGMFNLGIGLVDGLCDEQPATGRLFLKLFEGQDLTKAADEPRGRGWLRARLPPALAINPTVAFTVDIIEVFFEMLHVVYRDHEWLQQRHGVGRQLDAALDAERQSVIPSANRIAREQLIECSRLTSVLPFQIIERLAIGDHAHIEPSAGTQLGEAMWRIDDLVDLCHDARSGSLNGVLLAAADGAGRPGERELVAALERLLASTNIASAAREASEMLLAALNAGAGCNTPADHLRIASFLQFIQRYAGIAPRPRLTS